MGSAASGETASLQDSLNDVTHLLLRDEPIINIVDIIAKPAVTEPSALAELRLDFAAYTYFCATLLEIFTDRLNNQRIISATSESRGPASFDSLADARNAFALDTMLAWQLISKFRRAWGSPDICEPPQRIHSARLGDAATTA